MRPQITFPKSLKRALNYHEKKVQKGAAELLHAHSFYKSPKDMTTYDKMQRFEELMKLNDRAENKLIHISLNFHPSEKEKMTKEFYTHLADEYMHKIGFGDQPYLVYQHEDAGHPHVHVLSTLIRDNGTRISTQYIGKNISEPVRKEMEKQYGLIPADKKQQQAREDEKQLVITPQKIKAGQSATMRSITNVLDHVLDSYKYASVEEFNSLLRLYNVKADRGAEDGRIHKHKGLTYVVIDEKGKALTKPVKASAFHSKPTLKNLEEKFASNEKAKQKDSKHTKNAIDLVFQSKPTSLQEFSRLLQKERIDTVIRSNEEGRIYGITYINHEKKSVFKGSDLDKEYAAKRILERLNIVRQPEPVKQQDKTEDKQHQTSDQNKQQSEESKNKPAAYKEPGKILQRELDTTNEQEIHKPAGKIIEQVVGPDYGDSAINKELLTEEQKRRKKNFEKKWEM